MSTPRDTAAILAPPPVLFFAMLAAAWLLGRWRPMELPLSPSARAAVSVPLFLVSFAIALPALGIFHRHGTPAEPWKPTVRIVTAGPYRFTRNPMYVGLLLVMAGLAAATASLWMTLAVPALFALLHFGVVLPEERYLTRRFGEPYVEFTRSVRRWI